MARVLRFCPILIVMLLTGCMNANPAKQLTNMPANTGFILRESNGAAGRKKYTVFIPRDYNPGRQYPAIVFLHGIGESGGDGVKPTTVGIGPAIARRNGSFPFIVIFPQTGMDWTSDRSEQIMLDALADVKKNYSVDDSRISLSGLSSGGKGTWVLGARHPEIFSALVPMGGFAAYGEVDRLRTMPIWALHNSGDFIVPVGGTREMVKRIRAAGNPSVRYDEFSAGGHNCWDAAYDKGELFSWLQTNRRGAVAAGVAPANTRAR